MAKKTNPLKAAAPVTPAVAAPTAAAPVTPAVTPAVAPAVTPAVAAPKAETQAGPKKLRVHSKTGGIFVNPFTHEEIGSEPTFATQDSWLDSQIAANKIEKA
jgi:hypothetical protein